MQPVSNYSDYESPRNLTAIQHASILLTFSSTSVIGFVGNGWMLAILTRVKPTFFTVIIAGLSMSDLISAINSPFYIRLILNTHDYGLPYIFCLLTIPLDVVTSSVTAHHVFLLNLIRFRSITSPTGSREEMSAKTCRVLCIASYTISFITNVSIGVGVMKYRKIGETKYYCNATRDLGGLLAIFVALSNTLNLLIPATLTIVLCIGIMVFLVHRRCRPSTITQSDSSRKKERQALTQLAVIVIIFVVGYSSDCAAKLYLVMHRFNLSRDISMKLSLVTHGILRVCECVNPFVYYFASSDIKEGNKRLLNDLKASAAEWSDKMNRMLSSDMRDAFIRNFRLNDRVYPSTNVELQPR